MQTVLRTDKKRIEVGGGADYAEGQVYLMVQDGDATPIETIISTTTVWLDVAEARRLIEQIERACKAAEDAVLEAV